MTSNILRINMLIQIIRSIVTKDGKIDASVNMYASEINIIKEDGTIIAKTLSGLRKNWLGKQVPVTHERKIEPDQWEKIIITPSKQWEVENEQEEKQLHLDI